MWWGMMCLFWFQCLYDFVGVFVVGMIYLWLWLVYQWFGVCVGGCYSVLYDRGNVYGL